MPSGWNDWLTLYNTAGTVMETILLPLVLLLAGERARKWWKAFRGKGDDDGN